MHILSVEGRWNVTTPSREGGSEWADDDDAEEEGALRTYGWKVMRPEAGKPDDKPRPEKDALEPKPPEPKPTTTADWAPEPKRDDDE